MKPKLTLAIPTYNRSAQLRDRLEEICLQLHESIEILICNNGSTDGTEEICSEYKKLGIRVVSNKTNMGLSRNMLLAFEQAEGDWLWTLGDDDPIQSDALEKALSLIERFPLAGVINFKSDSGHNDNEVAIHDLRDYFMVKDVTDVMFMSSNIYNLRKTRPCIIHFAQATITKAPHVVFILSMLESGLGSLQLVTDELLIPHGRVQRWSSLELALGVSLIPEFIRDPYYQKEAALSAWYSTRWMQKYGLREVTDKLSFKRWRRICRSSNSLLYSYGVNWIGLLTCKRRRRKDLVSGIILLALNWCPFSLIKSACLRLSERRSGKSIIFDN